MRYFFHQILKFAKLGGYCTNCVRDKFMPTGNRTQGNFCTGKSASKLIYNSIQWDIPVFGNTDTYTHCAFEETVTYR